MFSCMARFQPRPKTSMPTPAANAPTTSSGSTGLAPRMNSGTEKTDIPSIPTSSGRRRCTPRQDDGHRQHADGLGGEHVAPAPLADRVLRDGRAEGEPGPGVDRVEQPERQHDHPEPGVAGEDRPALLELGDERRRLAGCGGSRAGIRTPSSSAAETSQVAASTASAQPGPDRDDQHGGDGRSDDRERRPLHGEQHVGGLEVLARHQGRHDARHGGEADGREGPVDGGQADQVPELGGAGQDQGGDGRPGSARRRRW